MNTREQVPKEEVKEFIRLVHPVTGDFIAEYYPKLRCLKVTKHRQTATIWLDQVEKEYEYTKSGN